MRVDVYKKLRRRRGKLFDKEITGNRAEGAGKNSGPPSWTKEKILAPIFDPVKNFCPPPQTTPKNLGPPTNRRPPPTGKK